MLLEAGADPNLTCMVPQKVSGFCWRLELIPTSQVWFHKGCLEVVKVLLEAGADPNLTGMVPQRVPGGGEGAAGGWS